MNLLPWREKRQKKEKRQEVLYFMGITFLVFLGIGMVHQGFTIKTARQMAHNQALEQSLALLSAKMITMENCKLRANHRQASIDRVFSLVKKSRFFWQALDAISQIMPEGLWLDRMRGNPENIFMRGLAKSHAKISAFLQALQGDPWMKNLALSDIKTIKNVLNPSCLYSFQLKLALQEKAGLA